MSARSVFELLALAALWGGSFICLRIAAPQFGAIPLIFLRVSIATLALAPFALRPNQCTFKDIKSAPWAIFSMGLFMSAIPFTLFAYASHFLEAGIMVIINATSPIWAALISSKINGYRINRTQGLGMGLGMLGVTLVAWNRLGITDSENIGLAIAASIGAALCYGIGSSLGKRYLHEVRPMSIAFGSMAFATATLTAPALLSWPTQTPTISSWTAAGVLGVACTATASLLFFHLTKTIGGERAIAVTFLQPLFGIAWGALLLGESISPSIMGGGLIILVGTALSTKTINLPQNRH